MIKRLIFVTILSLSMIEMAQSYISPHEVQIPFTNNGNSYVDVQTLREIIQSAKEESTDATVRRLNDYFSSASLTVNPQGGFTLLNPHLIFSTNKITWDFDHRTPLFSVNEPVNVEFALAYATFLSQATENLIPTINEMIKAVDSTEWRQEHYSFYYLCLRTLAVTQVIDTRVARCLDESITHFKVKNSQVFLQMANLYMKLYRASRFVFESLKEKDIFKYPKVEPFYDRIDIRTDDFKLACQPLQKTFLALGATREALRQDSLNRLPGGLMSSIAWRLFGSDQSTRNYNAIFAMPNLAFISGPYFDAITEKNQQFLHSPDYNHLCGEFW